MRSTYLLPLLFYLSLAQGDLLSVDYGDSDFCTCQTRTFGVDEMNATIKFVQTKKCPEPVTCLVYIKPLPDHIVSLEDKYIWAYYNGAFKVSYYQGETDEKDMIPMAYPQMSQIVSDTPPGVGIFINYTRDANQTVYDFGFGFERIPISEARKICPPPVLNVTSTKQTVSADNWPKNGCAFRIQADRPGITMLNTCPFGWGSSLRLMWKRNMIQPEIKTHSYNTGSWYTLDQGTDVLFKAANEDVRKCELSFVSPEYNPCNCSKELYTLAPGETLHLESPGFPEMFCPMANCHYYVNLTTKEDHDHMNTFVIETIHLPQGEKEEVSFKMNGEKIQLEKWFGKTSMNILTGEMLEIDYTALSVLSSEHGFSMNITAYKQPHDCRCPSNSPKVFTTDDSHEMSIPPHCTHMMCRFAMQNSSKLPQILHLDVDYTFHSDVLHVKGDHEFLLHTEPKLRQNHSSDIQSNSSQVMVTYLRQGVRPELNKTSELKMKWHWVTKDECSCGVTSFKAEATKWDAFYSPRHPQDYCNNVDCTYNVSAPEGHHLQFMIYPFETEIHRDILKFFEGKKVLTQMSGHYGRPTTIETLDQHGTVTFHSDSSIVSKGFKVAFIAVPNVGYVPQGARGGYIGSVAIGTGILILVLLIALCKKDLLKRTRITLENPNYTFSANSEEIMMVLDDKE